MPPTVTYDLNRLQGISGATRYCVTLNPRAPLAEGSLLGRFEYRHPQLTTESAAAQSRWHQVSGVRQTHYCGAYWRYGFHEDGLVSAMRVARDLGVRW
jgi:predicted NAD/FAD-binding protein